MIKIAPEQGRAEVEKPATANTNLALAILFTNTLAPVPAIPAVQALLATVNTPPAPAPQASNGRTALV